MNAEQQGAHVEDIGEAIPALGLARLAMIETHTPETRVMNRVIRPTVIQERAIS